MVQINRPAKKRILRIRWRKELLKFADVVQLQIPDRRLDTHTFPKLSESGLADQARSRRIVVKSFNGRRRLPVIASDINESAIDLAQERQIQPANRFRFVHRLNGAGSNDRFSHAKNRLSGERCVIAQAEIVQFVQRNRLRVKIENGVRMSGLNRRRMRRVHHLHVSTRAPRATECAHGIHIPAHSPIGSVLSPYERSAKSESVLWRHAAGCDVERMVGK